MLNQCNPAGARVIPRSQAPVAGEESSVSDQVLCEGVKLPSSAVAHLPAVLLQAYAEIQATLRCLRESRDALDQAAVQKLQHTSAKLLEVSSATEVAATGILDSLDRASAMVDALDALDTSGRSDAADIRTRLRDELFQSISCLQFQDITTQQLRYASSMLDEMEQRMAGLAKALDPANLGAALASPASAAPLGRPQELTFDPGATVENAEQRQSLADDIFTVAA
jgi:hypothetical protein